MLGRGGVAAPSRARPRGLGLGHRKLTGCHLGLLSVSTWGEGRWGSRHGGPPESQPQTQQARLRVSAGSCSRPSPRGHQASAGTVLLREILLLCCCGHWDESVFRYFEPVTEQYEDWLEDIINKDGVQRGGSRGHLAHLHPPQTSSEACPWPFSAMGVPGASVPCQVGQWNC